MGWSKTEEELLKENWTKPIPEMLKLFPGKTRDAIRGKIYRMGFRMSTVVKELQEKFCDGCPSTYNDDCPVTKAGKTWRVCNWKAIYQETGVWGNKN